MKNGIKLSIGRLTLMIMMLLIVVLGGTFAWLTFRSNQSALVLTIGEINKTRIKLTPYEINTNIIGGISYTDGVYSDVTLTNARDENTTVTLFYRVNNGNTYSGDLYYTIVDTDTGNIVGGSASATSSNKLTPSSITEDEVILSTEIDGSSTSTNYRVYLWANGAGEDTSSSQGESASLELNAAIGSVNISGTNTYGETLVANITDSSSTSAYTYQWYYNTTKSTTGGTAITGATSSTYKIQSGLVGTYIYVEVTAGGSSGTTGDYSKPIVYSNVTSTTVSPATPVLTLSGNSNYTYSGKGVAFVSNTSSSGTATLTYYTGNGCSESNKLSSAPIDASNNYSVNAIVSAGMDNNGTLVRSDYGTNYDFTAGETSCFNFKISPKKVQVDWTTNSNYTYIYNGANHHLTASVAVSTNATDVSTDKKTVKGETMTLSTTGAHTAGANTVSASCISVTGGRAKCSNYTLSYNATDTMTIAKYTPTITLVSSSIPSDKSVYITETKSFDVKVNKIVLASTTVGDEVLTGKITSAGNDYVTVSPTSTSVNPGTADVIHTTNYTGVTYVDSTTITVKYVPDDTNNFETVSVNYVIDSGVDNEGGVKKVTPVITLSDTTKTFTGSAISSMSATASYYSEYNNSNYNITNLTYTYRYYMDSTCITPTTTSDGSGAASRGAAPVNVRLDDNGHVIPYYVQAVSAPTDIYNSASSPCSETTRGAKLIINKYTPTITLGASSGSIEIGASSTFTAKVTTIAKCSGTLSAASANSTYVSVTPSSTSISKTATTTLTYNDPDTNDYATGDTVITISYAPTSANASNCNSASNKTFTATVTKRTPTVSLVAKTATYTGSAISANAATATYGGSDVTGLSYTYTYYTDSSCTTKTTTSYGASSSGAAPKDARTSYYVIATSAENDTYFSANSPCTKHTINKKSIAVSWDQTKAPWLDSNSDGTADGFTYNGAEQDPTATAATGVSGETMTVSVTGKTDAGTSLTATAACGSVSGGRAKCANYTLTNTTSPTFVINKYTPKLYLSAASGSVAVHASKTFTATVDLIAGCKGTLKTTSASTAIVTASPASQSITPNGTITSQNVQTITYKGIGYSEGTIITVSFTPTSTKNCNTPTSQEFTASVNRVNPTITLGNTTKTYTTNAIASNAATAKYDTNGDGTADSINLSYSYKYYTDSSCTTQTSTSDGSGAASAGAAPVNVRLDSNDNIIPYYVKATSTQTAQYNSRASNCAKLTINQYTPTIVLYETGTTTATTGDTIFVGEQSTFDVKLTTISECSVGIYASSANESYVSVNTTTFLTDESITHTITYEGKSVTSATDLTVYANKSGGLLASSNCSSAEPKTYTVTVIKKTPTIEWSAKSTVYNGRSISANAAVLKYGDSTVVDENGNYGSYGNGITRTYTYYNGTSCSGTSISAPTNVGNYSAKVVFSTNSDFESVNKCVTHTITKKDVTVNWAENESFIYNKKTQKPTASVAIQSSYTVNDTDGLVVNGDTVTLSVTGGTNAGTYTATASTTNGNYNLTNKTKSFSISKKNVNVIWTNTTFTYDGSAKVPTASVETSTLATDDSTDGKVVKGDTLTLNAVTGSATNAGTYTANVTTSNKNYNLVNTSTSFTINKASCACTISSVPNLEYPTNTSLVTGSTYGNVVYACTGDGTRNVVPANNDYLTVGTIGTTSTKLTAKNYITSGTNVTVSQAEGTNYLACTTDTESVVINPSKYTITFDVNAANYTEYNGPITSTAPAAITKTYGSSITLPTQLPRYYGYRFLEWNTKADGTGTTYAAGATFSEAIESNITLYARWEKKDAAYLMEVTTAQDKYSYFLRSTRVSRNTIGSITFVAGVDGAEDADGEVVDVSAAEDGSVLMWYIDQDNGQNYDVFIGSDADFINITSGYYLFSNLNNIFSGITFNDNTSYSGYEYLLVNASNITNTSHMFENTDIRGEMEDFIENMNTSNVTDMSYMFNNIDGTSNTSFELDLSDWNVSNVTNMSGMFQHMDNFWYSTGASTTFSLTGLNGWNTSSVTNMSHMFYGAGLYATTWSIGDISGWDTSSVTNMSYMFMEAGEYATNNWSFGNISGWDTSSVTNMSYMFYGICGDNRTQFELDLSNWDTGSVTNMSYMFSYVGSNIEVTSFSLNVSGWDVSNVTNMESMFFEAGMYADNFTLNVSGWNTSSVTTADNLFKYIGDASNICTLKMENWNISSAEVWDNINFPYICFGDGGEESETIDIDVSGWTIFNVSDLTSFFADYHSNATNLIMDASNWTVTGATTMEAMFASFGAYYDEQCDEYYGVENLELDISGLSVTGETNMSNMFEGLGYLAENILINANNWNLPSVKDMSDLFYSVGYGGGGSNSSSIEINADNWNLPLVENLSDVFAFISGNYGHYVVNLNANNWETSNATDMSGMFYGINAGTLEINIDNLDTSNVTNMSSMFRYLGDPFVTEEFELDLSSFDTSSVTTMANMFDGSDKLSKITFGENFVFVGTNGYLPTPAADGRWYNNSTWKGYTPSELATFSQSNDTFAGTYIIEPYTITYYNGGTELGTRIVTTSSSSADATLSTWSSLGGSIATDLSNVGWDFSGWTTSPSTATEHVMTYNISMLASSNITKLYAVYERDLEFYSGTDINSPHDTRTQYYNPKSTSSATSVTTPNLVAISGKYAYRWKNSAGTLYEQGEPAVISSTANNKLYGVYNLTSATEFKTKIYNGTTTYVEKDIHYYSDIDACKISEGITIADKSAGASGGWSSSGWRMDSSASTASFPALSANTSIPCSEAYYAVYYRKVTFYSGSSKATTSQPQPTQYYNSAGNYTVDVPTAATLSGFDFVGWSTSTAAANNIITISNSKYTGSGGPNFYAVYSRTATFYYGENKANNLTATQYYNTNNVYSVVAPTVTTELTGWTMLGWRNDTTAGDKEYNLNATITVSSNEYYAVYSRTIKFKSGYAALTSLSSTDEAQYYSSANATTTVSSVISPSTATVLTNWSFHGWRDDTTADYREYSSGASITLTYSNVTTDIVYYAVYTRGYTVTYDGNGSTSGSTSSNSINYAYYNAGNYNSGSNNVIVSSESFTPKANGFSKTGYTFDGWNTSSNGSGTTYTANTSTIVNLTKTYSTDSSYGMTLYAQWIDNINPTCTVSADSYTTSNVILKVTGTDTGSGLNSSPYSWTSNTSGFDTTQTYDIGGTSTNRKYGTYTAYVKDAAGNVGSCSATLTDTTDFGSDTYTVSCTSGSSSCNSGDTHKSGSCTSSTSTVSETIACSSSNYSSPSSACSSGYSYSSDSCVEGTTGTRTCAAYWWGETTYFSNWTSCTESHQGDYCTASIAGEVARYCNPTTTTTYTQSTYSCVQGKSGTCYCINEMNELVNPIAGLYSNAAKCAAACTSQGDNYSYYDFDYSYDWSSSASTSTVTSCTASTPSCSNSAHSSNTKVTCSSGTTSTVYSGGYATCTESIGTVSCDSECNSSAGYSEKSNTCQSTYSGDISCSKEVTTWSGELTCQEPADWDCYSYQTYLNSYYCIS